MIKKGFKKIFLVLCLMFVSSMVFVACEKNKVKVSSVIFKETESITMIVGQTYSPNVSVLPSYATNRSYYFVVESNADVIKISGDSVVALKEGVAQLKVISSENEYLTDIIAVKVMPTAIDLEAPTNLSFDGEKFSFSAVDFATSYIIKINDGQEIDLGNTTSYTMSQYQTQFGTSAYDKVLNFKVRAVGDDRITVPSEYSDMISVLKISSPKDVRVENNVLKFTKINNVGKYRVTFETLTGNLVALDVVSSDHVGSEVLINISDYKEMFTGGQYFCSVVCSDEDYVKTENEMVVSSDKVTTAFDVLSKPNNLVISNYVLYWDSVLGASSYTLYDAQDNVLLNDIIHTSVSLKDLGLVGESHTYKIVANSDKYINVVSGMNVSETVSVRILVSPEVEVKDKSISWHKVDGATSYNLIIYENGVVKNDLNLVGLSYSVADFVAGNYTFEIYSCGDNKQTLTSLNKTAGDFKVLSAVTNLRVENKQILWDSTEEGVEFDLKIYNTNSADPYINATLPEKTFDISAYDFDPGQYTIKIETLGENKVFNSAVSSKNFYKLSENKSLSITNGVVRFTIDERTERTEILCYDANNINNTYDVLTGVGSSKNQYSLDETSLPVGQYKIATFAYGNNKDILDADNTIEDGRIIEIKKIGASSVSVNATDLYVYRNTDVDSAVSYELYENGTKVASFSNTENYMHDVSNLTAGEYEYTIKALGNNADILDGVMSTTGVKVLKLETPKLSLNKTTLIYTIKTTEDQDKYVDSYKFTVNGEPVIANSKTIDCTSLFAEPGSYEGKIKLVAKTSSDYDLILDSDFATTKATKINAVSTVAVQGNKIIIKPDLANAGDYTSTIRIGYKEGMATGYTYVEYKDATYDSGLNAYVFEVYDGAYNVTGPKKANGEHVFASAGEYDLKLTLAKSGSITSNEYSLGTVTKLEKVSSIIKQSIPTVSADPSVNSVDLAPKEMITFSAVDRATEYRIRIVKNGTYEVKVDSTKTSLSISELKGLFGGLDSKLSLYGGSSYDLEIIAIGNDDNKCITSNVSEMYRVRLIKWPILKIEADNKLYITDDTGVAEKVYLTLTDGNAKKEYKMLDVSSGQATLDLSTVTKLTTGEISISALFESSDGNTFESTSATIFERKDGVKACYTQLDQPELKVENGLLVWKANENARSYILSYVIGGVTETKILPGDDPANFSISGEDAQYELKGVDVGTSDITVKCLAKGWVTSNDHDSGNEKSVFYYDSPISNMVRITKLSQPTVSVTGGKIIITLNSTDYNNDYIDVVKINGADISSQVTVQQEIEIDGRTLLKYNSDVAIEEEIFTISLQAKNKEGCYILNAEDYSFSVKGLKTVSDIKISTEYDPSKELIETINSITWSANTLNTGLVSGYYITMKYKGVNYYYTVNSDKTTYTFPSDPNFGAGNYVIKIYALTNTPGYVNSNYSDEVVITVCEQPTNIRTVDGVVVWDKVNGASEYIVHLFDAEEKPLNSQTVNANELDNFEKLDFNGLRDYPAGLYKLKVCADNKQNANIVAGIFSDEIELLRLPEITKYKVENGELYLYTHSFTTKVELKLTSQLNLCEPVSYIIDVNGYIPNMTNWSSAVDLNSYLTQEYKNLDRVGWQYKKVEVDNGKELTSILNLLDTGYVMEVKALGNTTIVPTGSKVAVLSTVNSKVSTHANGLVNEYQTDVVGDNTNYVHKMTTPTVKVTDRGIVRFGLEANYVDCKYYNLDGVLDGLLLYRVNLTVGGTDYSFLAVDNYYIDCIDASLVHVYNSSTEQHTYYGYIKYEYETDKVVYINILRYKESQTTVTYEENLEIDFNDEYLYFVEENGDENGNPEITSITIKDGGNFNVSVAVLGDNTVYLTSNTSDVVSVVRYKQLELDVVNGYLTWENLKEGSDDPIYLLKVKDDSTGVETLVYIHDKNTTLNTNKLPINSERMYFVRVDTTAKTIAYMFDTIEDGSFVFGGGTYSVTVTTYYSDSTDNSKLEARSSATEGVVKLAQPNIYLQDGMIKWSQVSVGTVNLDYIEDYELIISGGDLGGTKIFKISRTDYEIKSGTINYLLPEILTDVNGDEYTFKANCGKYGIFVRACSDVSYVNSNFSNYKEFEINDVVTELQMIDGQLTWSWGAQNSEGSYEIKIIVYDSNNEKVATCLTTVSSKSYNLTSNKLDLNEKLVYIDGTLVGDKKEVTLSSNYRYEIYVKRLGDSQSLTGYYKDCVITEKLKAIDDNSVTSNAGVLIWEPITKLNGDPIDVDYIIEFIGSELPSVTVSGEETSFDFSEYDPGKYTFRIVTKASEYFTGNTSSEHTLHKLQPVGVISNPAIKDSDTAEPIYNVLAWDAVYATLETGEIIYADKYTVEVYNTSDVLQTQFELEDIDKTGEIKCNLTGIEVRDIKVRVRAVMTSESSRVINAEWSEFTKFVKAEKIDVKEFKISEDGLRFEWKGISTEQTNDVYILSYSYKESYDSTNTSTGKSIPVPKSNFDKEKQVYYYIPSIVGYYTNIRITVNRDSGSGNALSSDTVVMMEGNTAADYTFDKFASGEGTEGKPYIINTIEHLQNIKLFPEGNYKLNANLSLENVSEMLITDKFTGTFDGNGKILGNYTLETSENTVGLFRCLYGATISNLTINYANVTINSSYDGAMIYGGILAGMAKDSTITNVSITNSLLNVDGEDISPRDDSKNSKFYYGGMFGYIDNCTVTGANVQIGYTQNSDNNYTTLKFNGCDRDYVYYGGLAGYASNSTITAETEDGNKIQVYYEIAVYNTNNNPHPLVFFGGVVGAMENSNFSNMAVNLLQSNTYVGPLLRHAGICGYIYSVNDESITFKNISIEGTIHKYMCDNTAVIYSGTSVDANGDIKITEESITYELFSIIG